MMAPQLNVFIQGDWPAGNLLGSGEHLLWDIDLVELGYRVTEHVTTEKATHVVMSKKLAD